MNIILIGFRGTGKSTIGRIVAQRLGQEFIDADVYLEQKTGRSIKDIFAKDGENVFRAIETQVLEELCLQDGRVIATGGGAVTRDENVRRLKKSGIIVLLEADVDTIFKRIHRDVHLQQRRPALTDMNEYQEIEYLVEFRKPLYDKAADLVINTAKTPTHNAANKIITFLRNHVKDLKKVV